MSDSLIEYPAIGPDPMPAQPHEGIRVVMRDDGRHVDLLPSMLSSYLLPTLADFSLVRQEARSRSFRFTLLGGGTIWFDEVNDRAHVNRLNELFTEVEAVPGSIVSLGSVSVGLLGQADLVFGVGRTEVVTSGPPALTDWATRQIAAAPATEAVAAFDNPSHLERLAPDAPIADVASRIAVLSGLSDELLAKLFKVERETFCRWRTGVLTNPRPGNRRRLGLLLTLVEDLTARDVSVKEWLLNFTTPVGLTPYQLLQHGRFNDVAYFAALVGEPEVERDSRITTREEPEPLEFGDDDVWELEPLDDER
ncbi:MAG TPA: hypothetical protein VMB51_14000 [Solirubrobacteraceae bacterium]|nr:hypothetical protein [Solirubrobacteraceae bacterium]